MIGFFSYYTHIIPRWSCIWLVLGLAIWRFLAIWRPILFSPKNGYIYIVTQAIKDNVTIGTQGMREPPARACRKRMAGNVTCTPSFVDYDFRLKDRLKDKIKSLPP